MEQNKADREGLIPTCPYHTIQEISKEKVRIREGVEQPTYNYKVPTLYHEGVAQCTMLVWQRLAKLTNIAVWREGVKYNRDNICGH